MTKNYKRLLCGVSLALAALSASAQENYTMYFMKQNPVRHALNPSFMPEGYNVYVGLPMSNIDFGIFNNSLTVSDFCSTNDGIHPFTDSLSTVSVADMLDKLHRHLRVGATANFTVINFGFKTPKKHFYNFSYSLKMDGGASLSREIITDFLSDVKPGSSFSRDYSGAIDGKMMLYSEYAAGFAMPWGDDWTFGAKLKYLKGIIGMKTDVQKAKVDVAYRQWAIDAKAKVNIAAPLVSLKNSEEGGVDIGIAEDMNFMEIIKPGGHGFAVDLGAQYKMLDDRLLLSAALTDFGGIRWKNNVSGVDIDLQSQMDLSKIDENTTPEQIEKVQEEFDKLEKKYYHATTGEAFTTWLHTKIVLAGEYNFCNDKIGLGLLSKTAFSSAGAKENLVMSANFRPVRQFSASLTYDWVSGRFHNIGLGINFNLGPINFYGMIDKMIIRSRKTSFYCKFYGQMSVGTGLRQT